MPDDRGGLAVARSLPWSKLRWLCCSRLEKARAVEAERESEREKKEDVLKRC